MVPLAANHVRSTRPVVRRLGLIVLMSSLSAVASAEPAKPVLEETPLKFADEAALRAGLSAHMVGEVSTLVWSPDGTHLATVGAGSLSHIWDGSTGALTGALYGHRRPVSALTWSADGKRIATAAQNDSLVIWDARTGKALLAGATDAYSDPQLAFSPAGGALAVTGHGRMAIAELPDGPRVLDGRFASASALTWSPDGASVAGAVTDYNAQPPNRIIVWDAATGSVHTTLTDHSGSIDTIEWSPDGTKLASASDDETVRVWDPATGEEVFRSPAMTSYRTDKMSFSWSADSGTLAIVGPDGHVGLWVPATSTKRATLSHNGERYVGVRWSPGGALLAMVGADGAVDIYDVTADKPHTRLVEPDTATSVVAWSPDSTRIAIATDDGVLIADPRSGTRVAEIRGKAQAADKIAVSPIERLGAAAFHDGRIVIFDLSTGLPVRVLDRHGAELRQLVWSPDGTRLASADEHEMNFVWDPHRGDLVAALEGHTNDVLSLQFSPDGTRIATGSFDETARVWDAANGDLVSVLGSHGDTVGSVTWSPDSSRVATASDDGFVRVFKAADGEEIARHDAHGSDVQSVAWSPDGTLIASAGWDNAARLFDVASEEVTEAVCCALDNTGQLAWSPNGAHLATSANAYPVVWRARTGETVPMQTRHTHYPQFMIFSPDGEFLASGSQFAPALIHGVKYGFRITDFNKAGWIFRSLDWHRDGSIIATVDGNGLIETWSPDGKGHHILLIGLDGQWVSCDLVQSVCRRSGGSLLQQIGEAGLSQIGAVAGAN